MGGLRPPHIFMDKKDIGQAENILRALTKATYNDMLGTEVLALANCIHWLGKKIQEWKLEEINANKPKPPKEKKKNGKDRTKRN